MGDLTLDEVRSLLARHELIGEAFDATATAEDLDARIAMSRSLDALVEGPTRTDPTAFDPRWPAV